jgi:fatty acid desaturase
MVRVEEQIAARRGDREGLERLAAYHSQMTRDFQHERLIHLLVTFFFGGLLIGALVVFGLALAASEVDPWLLGALAALNLVLAALEAAYIGHYYHLENNVQALYQLTVELFDAADA